MAAKKKGRKAARVGGKKKAATKKAGAKRSAPKRAKAKKKAAPVKKKKGATAKRKAAPAKAKPAAKPAPKPAVMKPEVAKPVPRPAPAPVAPAGGVSTREVNRGHVFALQPRVNAGFSPQAFDDARRELSDVLYGTIDEAARAVAERALELSNERPDREPFPPS